MAVTDVPTRTFVDSTELLGDAAALTARADDDGYLFFRQLLPRADVLDLRVQILDVLAGYGWVTGAADREPGTLDPAAVASIDVKSLRGDIGVSTDGYVAVQKVEAVHRLPHHPVLQQLYGTLLGQPPLVHPRHIVRLMTSHPSITPTPVHQDFPLVQGTPRTWTAWFPVGDCPITLGPLAVLRGSHRTGPIPMAMSEGSDSMYAQLCPGEDEWVSGDLLAGDVLTFSSYTVHRAIRASDRSRIRISMDVRYQSPADPIEVRSLLPHADCSWDEIYRDWDGYDLQYYWAPEALNYAPYDESLTQPGRRIC